MNYGDPDAPAEFPVRFTPVEVEVQDGRASGNVVDGHISQQEASLMSSIEHKGFTLVDLPLPKGVASVSLFDPEEVERTYMPFVQEYLLQATGCDQVMPVNFVHRKSGTSTALPDGFTQNVPKTRLGNAAPEDRTEDADEHFAGR